MKQIYTYTILNTYTILFTHNKRVSKTLQLFVSNYFKNNKFS